MFQSPPTSYNLGASQNPGSLQLGFVVILLVFLALHRLRPGQPRKCSEGWQRLKELSCCRPDLEIDGALRSGKTVVLHWGKVLFRGCKYHSTQKGSCDAGTVARRNGLQFPID